MEFKTREQIDEHYRVEGLDIPKLHNEFNQVSRILRNEEAKAIFFLKKKMGIFKFWLWKNISCIMGGPEGRVGFGENGYIEKAKEYGFKDNVKFAVREVLTEQS